MSVYNRNYQDSHSNDWEMYKREPDEENFKIHTFDEVGVYWVTVTAVNSVGTTLATVPEPVMVQHPVIGFTLQCSKLSPLVLINLYAPRYHNSTQCSLSP